MYIKQFFIPIVFISVYLFPSLASAHQQNAPGAAVFQEFFERVDNAVPASHRALVEHIARAPGLTVRSEILAEHQRIREETRQEREKRWQAWRMQVIDSSSLEKGMVFIRNHSGVLTEVEDKYGVPQEVIAAILRVETIFGEFLGDYTVPNVFLTRYVHASSQYRRNYAVEQMSYFVRYCYETKCDPFTIQSSRAGAFGLPQFIPWSWAHFAEDGNGDGMRDLFDPHDAAASIGRYLSENGWARSRKQALYAYNKWYFYGTVVLDYAQELKRYRRIYTTYGNTLY